MKVAKKVLLHDISVWRCLARLAYLTITYQLVKIFAAALKKAAKIQSNANI